MVTASDDCSAGHHHLHQLQGRWAQQLLVLLLHLPHQDHSRYACIHAGNYSGSADTTLTAYDTLLVAGLPALNFLALLLFALIWKVHRRRVINKQEEDNNDVKPEKFCIEF